jgi:hypothetical protein
MVLRDLNCTPAEQEGTPAEQEGTPEEEEDKYIIIT